MDNTITVDGKEVEAVELKESEGFGSRENLMTAFENLKLTIEKLNTPEADVYRTTAVAVLWNTLSKNYHLIPKNKEAA